ncbi:uncharacterized protein B0P05DRAFT_624970, partial [Gilbertella persicaria]|uniref:uncharacterized protein n=1 Tax=Gilbertella persicaria TaxID=101096 RepID=UPI0022202576
QKKNIQADKIIRLAELDDLEVLVLETAGAFGHEDHEKIAFDNSKGIFTLLAMLETVADNYKYASVESLESSNSISCNQAVGNIIINVLLTCTNDII